jgi:hypothetical protein
LFYLAEGNQLMVVRVEAKGTFVPGETRKLFDTSKFVTNSGGRPYDVSGDGKRFIMPTNAVPRGDVNRIAIVENWFEELKAKVRTSMESVLWLLVPDRVADADTQVRSAAAADLDLEEKPVLVPDPENPEEAAARMTFFVDASDRDRRPAALVDVPGRKRRERDLVQEDEVDQRFRNVAAKRPVDARAKADVIGNLPGLDVAADVALRRIDRCAAGESDALRVR